MEQTAGRWQPARLVRAHKQHSAVRYKVAARSGFITIDMSFNLSHCFDEGVAIDMGAYIVVLSHNATRVAGAKSRGTE